MKQHNTNPKTSQLTDLGFNQQCQTLSQHLRNHVPLAQTIDLIVVSPMLRTLQTAQQSLGWLIDRGVPVLLRPEWQENSAKPCDTGTAIPIMEKAWPQFNWADVDPLFPKKEGLYEYSQRGLTQRGIEARKWLRGRPEKCIAVVSHSGFLRVGVSYRKYENADFRIFGFEEGGEWDGLVEWEETEKNGGGLGLSPKGVFDVYPMMYPKEVEGRAVGEVADELPK
ncbi:putative phosphatase [Lachnellula willkommii]|uniref:Putative phosphatase n=1 Tax=Lachnellula willkommii TaxID=215461 RepID=A0A559LYT0_9HELO|nr:putative phosphatase [Lachnellula willkommii]